MHFVNNDDIAVNFAHVNAQLGSKAYQPINRLCKKNQQCDYPCQWMSISSILMPFINDYDIAVNFECVNETL
jgi:hypothetical protein